MLKKIHRITKQKDFDLILKTGKKIYSPTFIVRYLSNDQNLTRIGIIVSNKVSKKATTRNRIKRKIRESIRLSFSKLKNGQDIIIITSPKIIDKEGKILNFQEIDRELKTLLKKEKLI